MKKILIVLFAVALYPLQLMSQNEVLLTIDGQPILRSEFERIYHKNSNIEGYENKPAAEYLDMFVNFKLKVLEARNLGFDTLTSFINELHGYREQLSRPYLQDRSLIDELVKEAYQRSITEVNASHIMVKSPSNSSPADTMAAYNKVLDLKNRLTAGESFEKIAREESDDPSGKINGGKLGWFSAFTMVYPFENAAYKLNVGEYSKPVKSRYGYHIIRVNDFRPAMGEIKLSHIMVRTEQNENGAIAPDKKEKIFACYNELKNGISFTSLVKKYSEDAGTVRNNGEMRWLRSGELPAELENIVFAMADSGAFTEPLQSDYGWHIFQLQGKRAIAPFEQLKSQLEEKILMDERGKQAEQSFMNNLKKEYGYVQYSENITMISEIMDSSIYSGNWKPMESGTLIEPVFTIGGKDYSQMDLIDFIIKTKRYNEKDAFTVIIHRKLNELVFNELLNHEKKQLEAKYPSFRYLMEEYHDGILLFNIMDDKVWSRAVSDTNGLKTFYEDHAGDYQWQERVDVSVYTLKNKALLKNTIKLAKKRVYSDWKPQEFVRMLCTSDSIDCVAVNDQKYEKSDLLPLGGFIWKKGKVKTVNESGGAKVLVVNEIIPSQPKTFNETQGQVTADYQNYLDRQWIDSLRDKYEVVINPDVLKLVK